MFIASEVSQMKILPVFLLFSALYLSCQPAEKKPERKEELSREATRLRLGMALTPEDPTGYLELGEVYHEMGEYEKAIEQFQGALAIDEQNAQVHNALGLVYIDMQLTDPALSLIHISEPTRPY